MFTPPPRLRAMVKTVRFIEAHPAACSNGHRWDQPGTHYPGWDNGILTGGMGRRTWTCATCGDIRHRGVRDPVFAEAI